MKIGVLGGGQLGRMMALAGIPLGLRFVFLDPDPDCPAAELGEVVVGAYDDHAALDRFARGIDVATYEFENVPAQSADWLGKRVAVHPPRAALEASQDRVVEKRCFRSLGIVTPDFEEVDTLDGLHAAVSKLGTPCVLKTRRFGYDGKGQAVIREASAIDDAWRSIVGDRTGPANLILEAFVPFEREVSIIGVRARDGRTAFYPAATNTHARGILSVSVVDAQQITPALQNDLEAASRKVMEHLDYVGVLTIEFFVLAGASGHRLVANEMAPRVHNSGHWTIEGSSSSQFENHIRAVAGLPLGSTAMRSGDAAVMYNIIGRMPPHADVLHIPGVHLHDYGKDERPGRKLGHATVCGPSLSSIDKPRRALEALLERAGARP